jgi:hypothetical protein
MCSCEFCVLDHEVLTSGIRDMFQSLWKWRGRKPTTTSPKTEWWSRRWFVRWAVEVATLSSLRSITPIGRFRWMWSWSRELSEASSKMATLINKMRWWCLTACAVSYHQRWCWRSLRQKRPRRHRMRSRPWGSAMITWKRRWRNSYVESSTFWALVQRRERCGCGVFPQPLRLRDQILRWKYWGWCGHDVGTMKSLSCDMGHPLFI